MNHPSKWLLFFDGVGKLPTLDPDGTSLVFSDIVPPFGLNVTVLFVGVGVDNSNFSVL